MKLTADNEWNPTSLLLGSTVLINRIKPEPGFKEKMLTLLPQNISQTTRFDDALEDLPTRYNYYSTERHINIPAYVLADQFLIGIKIANATLKSNFTERHHIIHTPY